MNGSAPYTTNDGDQVVPKTKPTTPNRSKTGTVSTRLSYTMSAMSSTTKCAGTDEQGPEDVVTRDPARAAQAPLGWLVEL